MIVDILKLSNTTLGHLTSSHNFFGLINSTLGHANTIINDFIWVLVISAVINMMNPIFLLGLRNESIADILWLFIFYIYF